ncbi:MAG: aminopeptidase P N-terminal domain-containing protein, partial [Candidatus Saccharimonadales bacterium]
MTAPKFTKDFFVGNRRALLERSGLEVVVIPAAGLLQRSADTTYTFQQDRNFWYLTGLDQPDVVLVMTPGESFLIEAARSAARQAFDGAGDAASAIASAGIDSTYSERAGWERLSDIVSKLKLKSVGVLTAPASYLGSYGFYTNPSRKRLATRLARRFPNTTQVSVSEQLARLRAQKQPVEIATLQRAIDRTTQSLDIVRTQLDSFQYEYEIEAFLSQQFRAHGDDGHAFEPIIASGAHATTLHYIENNGRLQSGDLLVCDVGAKTAGYCADVTRTFRYGRATARQRAVHEAVLQVQGYA